MRTTATTLLLGATLIGTAAAQEAQVTMNKITAQGVGEPAGTVAITPGDAGLSFALDLRGLPAGERGFHLHETGDCGPGPNDEGQVVAGGAAGGHWDPEDTGEHLGPAGEGHQGDLPAITVTADGTATGTVTAPRIKDLEELRGKALMVHAGGDNYSDAPEPLGGGGGRIACGVIE